ncbi:hypothetical protein C8J28_109164 [Cereibacter azotoformans]|uniref:Uncharacterized protein n=2 Tax=Cereibacter azotoformans TaxID=43057 RepID=A0A2T5K704_9RHOB|nr:hypothetical protein C8J28_109164 [Cereibacter azotoformans]
MKIEAFTTLLSKLIADTEGDDYTYWIDAEIDEHGDGKVTLTATYDEYHCYTDPYECWAHLTGPGICLDGYCDSGIYTYETDRPESTDRTEHWVTWCVADGEICAGAATLVGTATDEELVAAISMIAAAERAAHDAERAAHDAERAAREIPGVKSDAHILA